MKTLDDGLTILKCPVIILMRYLFCFFFLLKTLSREERLFRETRKSRLDEVETVRDFYAKRYSWSEQCEHLIKKMVELVDGMNYI